ncbi:MAG TPA: class I SAM-dependent methyltransferase [Mycobacteriales bacterium]|nr:class I SAM-dependent methyltransferase [Mycobacteriales bacterium]
MTTSWDAELYAANTAHHRRHDSDVLGGLSLPAGSRALDVGCGVGDFTAGLAGLGEAVTVLGVDADPGMVATAAQRYGSASLSFEVCAAQELDRVVPAASVDAVFSVAALHWVPAADHPGMLAQVRRTLRPGGLFRAEFGGAGQIAPVKAILDEESARLGGGPAGWFFPSPEQYRPLLAAAGFAVPAAEGPAGKGPADGGPADGAPAGGWVRLLRQVREFPAAEGMLGWLRSQTFPAYEPVLPAGASAEFRARCEQRAASELRRADGSFDIDFVRLDLLVRPS